MSRCAADVHSQSAANGEAHSCHMHPTQSHRLTAGVQYAVHRDILLLPTYTLNSKSLNSQRHILTRLQLRVHLPRINNHWLSKCASHACIHLGTSQELIHWLDD